MEELTAEKVQIEESIRGREGDSEDLELLYDKLVILRDKAAIRQNLLVTKKTFYMSGWLPAKAADKVSSLLEEVGCYYQIEDPEKGEETPVLLLNGGFSTPSKPSQSSMRCRIPGPSTQPRSSPCPMPYSSA